MAKPKVVEKTVYKQVKPKLRAKEVGAMTRTKAAQKASTPKGAKTQRHR